MPVRDPIVAPDVWLAVVRREALGAGEAPLQNHEDGRLLFLDQLNEPGTESAPGTDIEGLSIQRQSTLDAARGVGAAITYDLRGRFPHGDAAYGVVLDVNGDGAGDYIVGMDNLTESHLTHAEWIGDLATGRVSVNASRQSFGHGAFDIFMDSWFPGESRRMLIVGRTVPQTESLRFYFWSASLHDGRIFVDHAPDTDWIAFTR